MPDIQGRFVDLKLIKSIRDIVDCNSIYLYSERGREIERKRDREAGEGDWERERGGG